MRRGGMGSRPTDRVGLGRFPEDRGSDNFKGSSWNRDKGPNDLERERFRGNYGVQASSFQGGFGRERGRFDQQKLNNNKHQFEDRERMEWEENDLRAKLKKRQEEWRGNEPAQWNRHREES
jgi:hypothetical protein